MRVSREQAEKNHQAVINTASRLFRERGFDGIGLMELMEGAGLTKGGFYKQFASKEDLAAKAAQRSMEMAMERWSTFIKSNPDVPLEGVLACYLSMGHRDDKAEGCPLVALGADAARQGPDVRASFEAGVKDHLEILKGLMPAAEDGQADVKAMAALALMVGAVTLSRVFNDENLSREFLEAAAGQVRAIAAR
jgi:TetR/AcrR family transcriptional repressor of nem operon